MNELKTCYLFFYYRYMYRLYRSDWDSSQCVGVIGEIGQY